MSAPVIRPTRRRLVASTAALTAVSALGGIAKPYLSRAADHSGITTTMRCGRRRSSRDWVDPTYFSASPHLSSIARASPSDSAEVGGKRSRQANGRQASMIILECELTPRSF